MPSASKKPPETTMAEPLKALRKRMGLSVEQFATLFLVSPRTVEQWEQGRRKPRGLTLQAIQKEITKRNKARNGRGLIYVNEVSFLVRNKALWRVLQIPAQS